MDYILILCFLVIGIIIGYLLGTYTNFTGKNNSIRLGQAPNGLPITFKITTSNDYYSGTDSTVYILLYNNTKPGNMQKFILDTPKYNDFERGDSYDYKIQDKNIGMESLNMPIGLGIDGSDQWKVESVEIYYNNVFVKKYRPNIWLGGATKLIKLENNYNIITAKDLEYRGKLEVLKEGYLIHFKNYQVVKESHMVQIPVIFIVNICFFQYKMPEMNLVHQ